MPGNTEDIKLRFGPYKHETYNCVKEKYPEYCKQIISQKATLGLTQSDYCVRHFIDYLEGKPRLAYIYLHTYSDRSRYIGRTENPASRLSDHKCNRGSNDVIVSYEILETVPYETVKLREEFWINELKPDRNQVLYTTFARKERTKARSKADYNSWKMKGSPQRVEAEKIYGPNASFKTVIEPWLRQKFNTDYPK